MNQSYYYLVLLTLGSCWNNAWYWYPISPFVHSCHGVFEEFLLHFIPWPGLVLGTSPIFTSFALCVLRSCAFFTPPSLTICFFIIAHILLIPIIACWHKKCVCKYWGRWCNHLGRLAFHKGNRCIQFYCWGSNYIRPLWAGHCTCYDPSPNPRPWRSQASWVEIRGVWCL